MIDLVEIEKKIPEKELKFAKSKVALKKKSILKRYLHVSSGPGFTEYIECIKSISDKLVEKYSTIKPKKRSLSLWG